MPDPQELRQAMLEAIKRGQSKAQEATELEAQKATEVKPLTVGDRIRDTVDSINSGIGTAVHETAKAGVWATTKLMEKGEGLTNAVTGSESNIAGQLRQGFNDWSDDTAKADGSVYESKTVVGMGAQGVSQFLTGFLGAGKILQGAKWFGNLGTITKGMVQGAAADATVFDPRADRLSNLAIQFGEDVPGLKNPLTEYLAADEADGEAEGRFKSAVEGLVAGGLVDGLLRTASGFRKVWKVKESGAKPEEVQKVWAQVTEALEAEQVLGKPATGIPEGQISGGTRGMGPEEIVDSSRTAKGAKQASEATNDVEKLGLNEYGFKDEPDLPNYTIIAETGEFVKKGTKPSLEGAIDAVAGINMWKKFGNAEEVAAHKAHLVWNLKGIGEDASSFWDAHGDAIRARSAEKLNDYNAHVKSTPFLNDFRGALNAGDDAGVDGALRDLGVNLDDIKQIDAEMKTPQATQAPEKTQVTEALTPVEGAQKEVAGMKPDDSMKNGQIQGRGAPLLSDEAQKALTKELKDNPDWLVTGFVNTQKAGFNFTKMDSPDGAKLAIEEMAQYLPPVDPMSAKTIEADAKVLGINVLEVLQTGKVSIKDLPKTIVASRMLLQSQARQVADFARVVDANPARKPELQAAYQRLANLMTSVGELQDAAGRGLASFKIRTLDQFSDAELAALKASGGDVASVLPLIKEVPYHIKVMKAVNQYWINAILSGGPTQVRNFVSNTLNTGGLPLERIMGGVMMGNKAAIRNGMGLYMGLKSSFRDSLRLAVRASGLPDIVAAKGAQGKLNAAKQGGNAILDPGSMKMETGGPGFRPLTTNQLAPKLEGTIAGNIFDTFGEMSNVPSRFMTTADEFAKQINYRAQVYADAYENATAMGLKGDDLTEYITSRITSSMDEQGVALNKEALEYARTATFTTQLDPKSFLGNLERLASTYPWIRQIIPFIRTPTNILGAALRRTPVLNLTLHKKYREAITGKLGKQAQADAVGQMISGGVLWGTASALAAEGTLTGKGPSDPRERAILMQPDSNGKVTWAPYSIKVGDSFYSYQGFDPISMFLGLAADYTEVSGHIDDQSLGELAANMSISLANNITSKTYLTGLTQVLEAITDPEEKMATWFRSRVASFIPTILKQAGSLIPGLEDPYMRETRNMADALLNRIPGFSQSLPPKRNIFGEPITARQALGPDTLSPFYSAKQTDNPAFLELARFSHAFTPPSPKETGVDLRDIKNAKGQSFYDRWQETISTHRRGRYTLKEAIEALVTSSRYAKWRENEPDALSDDFEPRTLKEVRALITEYRESAKKATLREFPEAAELMNAQRRAGKKAAAGADIPDQLTELIQSLSP